MKFGTSIHCMDGRIQKPILQFVNKYYGIDYLDSITEPGPNGIIFNGSKSDRIRSILERVDLSLNKHYSKIIFISGHHDCLGNPVPKNIQIKHLNECEVFLRKRYPSCTIKKLWINENWEVQEL